MPVFLAALEVCTVSSAAPRHSSECKCHLALALAWDGVQMQKILQSTLDFNMCGYGICSLDDS